MIRVAVDWEYSAEEWWDAARVDSDAPAPLHQMLGPDDLDEVTVTEEEAAAIRRWAATLPGWDGGPAHAPHPLTFIAAETEEVRS